MTTSDPQEGAEEVAASALANAAYRPYHMTWADLPEEKRRAFLHDAAVPIAALRDAGFLVVRLDEATKRAMADAMGGHLPADKRFTLAQARSYTLNALDAALSVLSSSTTTEETTP